MSRPQYPTPEHPSVKITTFMGIAGTTRWDAFHGWATRVRRHIGWRLIRPELDMYLDMYAADVEREGGWDDHDGSRAWCAWNALRYFRDWIQGPDGWTRS